MKSTVAFAFFLFLHPNVACAFQSSTQSTRRWNTRLFGLSTTDSARENLLSVANRLQADQGVFIYDKTAKEELTKAVSTLEAVASAPTREDYENKFQGDWTLIATTATNAGSLDFSKLPFLIQGPLKEIRATLNRSIKVQQRVRSTMNSTVVDRVDHVIEFQPPGMLMDVFGGGVPDALQEVNINPLEVSKAKVTLIHKATVESVTPALKTKIALQSIVLSVAGTSQLLDPVGADVLGINIPLGEFLNAGTFETTYMDDNVRISRGTLGLVEQLRVFSKNFQTPANVDAQVVGEQMSSGVDSASDVVLVSSEGDVTVNGMAGMEEAPNDTSEEEEESLPPSGSNEIS